MPFNVLFVIGTVTKIPGVTIPIVAVSNFAGGSTRSVGHFEMLSERRKLGDLQGDVVDLGDASVGEACLMALCLPVKLHILYIKNSNFKLTIQK